MNTKTTLEGIEVKKEFFRGKAEYEELSHTQGRTILTLPDDWQDFEVVAMRVKFGKVKQ